jgi:type IX secretion system PorP/SprF family membrane protein
MAGFIPTSDKVRLTARKQWLNQPDAPALQTISYNGRFGDNSGLGAIFFNDQNGYHSQKGGKLTYAHHIMFSRHEFELDQLSFGLSASFSQSQLDETAWIQSGDFDPIVNGIIIQEASYFNFDFGASYNFMDFYVHGTVQNLFGNTREIYSEFESKNLRKYLLGAGYYIGDRDNILFEPSVLFQLVDLTKEKWIDVNIKAYKALDFGKIWAALSYRRSFDGTQFLNGSGVQIIQNQQYITPILGVNYKKYMLSYTYSYLTGDVKFDSGGLHQLTLGMDLFIRDER